MNKKIYLLLILSYISSYFIAFISILHTSVITIEFIEFFIINLVLYYFILSKYEIKYLSFIFMFTLIIFFLHIFSYYLSNILGYTEKRIDLISEPLKMPNETVIFLNILIIFIIFCLYLIYLLIIKYILKKEIILKDYYILIGMFLLVFILDFLFLFLINGFLFLTQIKNGI